MMERLLTTLQKIIPKEMTTLQRRYQLLKTIHMSQPVGRRLLAQKLFMSEKIVRTDTEFMKTEGFIEFTPSGMILTDGGKHILNELMRVMRHFEDITRIEERVKRILGCQHLTIVPGDADLQEDTIVNLGKAASKVLIDHMQSDSIIALTGGSTIHHVVEAMQVSHHTHEQVLVVPARGSLGNNAEIQANTLVALLAKKLKCGYKLLSLPDNLSQKALESVSEEPEIQETLAVIKKANILLFGIGTAENMANRRNLDEEAYKVIQDKAAVAETLGYYFNQKGEIVFTSRSIGIKLNEMRENVYPIAVAGGKSKAEAIISVRKFISRGSLIIDEGAAKRIIELE